MNEIRIFKNLISKLTLIDYRASLVTDTIAAGMSGRRVKGENGSEGRLVLLLVLIRILIGIVGKIIVNRGHFPHFVA